MADKKDKMKIQNIKIDNLIGYEFNNKIHNQKQIDLLANSIKEYGMNSPIIIDSNNIIIAGHGRLEACKKLGLEKIPVIIKNNLTDKQVKKYRLLDNKIAELAENNIENIKLELEELQDLELDELYINLGEVDNIDYSNSNREIDINDFEDYGTIKLKYSSELYEEILQLMADKKLKLDYSDNETLILNILKLV